MNLFNQFLTFNLCLITKKLQILMVIIFCDFLEKVLTKNNKIFFVNFKKK